MRSGIGIIDLFMPGWSAGHTYSLCLARSLANQGLAPVLLRPSDAPSEGDLRSEVIPLEYYRPGEWTLRRLLGMGRRNMLATLVDRLGLESMGPVLNPNQLCRGVRNVAWIPDFQPFVLSHLYEAGELAKIQERTTELGRRADAIIVSSEDSRKAMERFFPAFCSKVFSVPFPSGFAFQSPPEMDAGVLERYHLPPRFLLVSNQLWKHKNPLVIPRALAILKKRGLPVTCVMTGLPADFRDRNNTLVSELVQEIALGNVSAECRFLGLVSRTDLLSLLRSTTALIQPSLFEGWNTTVQDAKALGCPLILSDLAVHREQAPHAGAFFDPANAEDLAAAIAALWVSLPARPNRAAEASALEAERDFAVRHGQRLAEVFLPRT